MDSTEKSINIFVGPRKTGTSWLYQLVSGEDFSAKEIYYPRSIGRNYVYKKYVNGKSLLIWPYLIHEPDSLDALLVDLAKNGVTPKLYWAERDEMDLFDSMVAFKVKYGIDQVRAQKIAKDELATINKTLNGISQSHHVVRVKIINPSHSDAKTIAEACGIPIVEIEKHRNNKVYVTDEYSRFNSSFIVTIFFRIKPFLPKQMAKITRVKVLRNLFFREKERNE